MFECESTTIKETCSKLTHSTMMSCNRMPIYRSKKPKKEARRGAKSKNIISVWKIGQIRQIFFHPLKFVISTLFHVYRTFVESNSTDLFPTIHKKTCLAFDNNSIRYLARAPIIILHYTYIASKRSKNEGWIYA